MVIAGLLLPEPEPLGPEPAVRGQVDAMITLAM